MRTALAARPWGEDLTLGEAVDYIRSEKARQWACACIGGPNCCFRVSERAQAVVRGAHIAIKQIAELGRVEP